MTGGKGLDYYIPQWARPTRDHARGDDMVNVELTPVSDESWGLLRVVAWIVSTVILNNIQFTITTV